MYMNQHVCVCVCMYTHMYVYMYMYIHTYVHKHHLHSQKAKAWISYKTNTAGHIISLLIVLDCACTVYTNFKQKMAPYLFVPHAACRLGDVLVM